MITSSPLLSLSGVGKTYGPTRALDSVTIDVHPGEVHALVGENGAGKSTLVKIMCGLVAPDEGTVRSPTAGSVHLVHQELSLLPDRTVAENMFLGQELTRLGSLRRGEMHRVAANALVRLNARIEPHAYVRDLSTARRQLVEIGRALVRDSKVVIFDEPTAALSPEDASALFEVIGELQADGVGVVYISHRLDEVLSLADRITVLKDGRVVDEMVGSEATPSLLIRKMVGRDLEDLFPERVERVPGEPLLRVSGLASEPHVTRADLIAHRGEIIGIYGLDGNGQDELLECLSGARRATAGSIVLDDRTITYDAVQPRIDAGITLVPEDRRAQGLFGPWTVRANVGFPLLRSRSRGSFLKSRAVDGVADAALDRAGVRGNRAAPIFGLSGGNQQKAILARSIAAESRLLLLNQPTRGVDVGSKSEIYTLIRKLCDEGAASVLVSREISELQGLCDRILVMSDGEIVGQLPYTATEQDVLALALGKRNT